MPKILDEILQEKLMDNERSHLSQNNYHMAIMMIANQQDFVAGSTLKQQLEFCSCKKLPEYDYLKETPKIILSDVFPCGNIGDERFAEKYQEKGNQAAIFLQRTDLSRLLILFTLLRNSNNFEVQQLNLHIYRLIMKKMRLCSELKHWKIPENGVQFLYQTLTEIGEIMQNVILASLMNKP